MFHGIAQTALKSTMGRFDLIVAFDVLEHLTVNELLDLMQFAKSLLTPDGRILARFPNGASPFSGPYQNGDITHMMVLTGERMRQIAHAVGMQVIGIHNAARSKKAGKAHGRLKKLSGYLVRDLVEKALGMLYFGQPIPLDPNLTVILSKTARSFGDDLPVHDG